MGATRALAACLILALAVSVAQADSFSANTTITWTNYTNGSTDTFYVGNASTITAANVKANFSRYVHVPTERRGYLFSNAADWAAGTLDGGAVASGEVIKDVAGAGSGNESIIWHLDDNGGGTAADSSGHGWDGTVDGSATWNTTGQKFGASALRQAADNRAGYVSRVNTSPVIDTNNFTIDYWVRPEYFTSDDRSFRLCTNSGACNDGGDFAVMIRHLSSWGRVIVYIDTVNVLDNATVTSFAAGQWTHIAFTHNETGNAIYGNGSLIKTTSSASGPTPSFDRMCFGGGCSSNLGFAGLVDDTCVSNGTKYSGPFAAPPSACSIATGAASDGAWRSPVKDTGVVGQKWNQLYWNSTVNSGNMTVQMRASNTAFAASNGTVPWVHITTMTNTSPACPCSTGTNMSSLTGNYWQELINFTTVGGAVDIVVNNTQTLLVADDTGQFQLNGANQSFINDNIETIPPGIFVTGTNPVLIWANNTSFYNINLTYSSGNGVLTTVNQKPCYTWKNNTMFANVNDLILSFNKPTGAGYGNFNTTVYINGTQNQTSNRTGTSYNYGVWETATQVFVENNSTLYNGTTFNVLVDWMCLNATARDASNGTAISSFTVQQLGSGGQTKSTTTGYIWFNGTEVVGGGSGGLSFRASATNYNFADATLDLSAPLNYTFGMLLSTSSALYSLLVHDTLAQAISGAIIQVTDTNTGVVVFTGSTDSAGQAVTHLVPGTLYLFQINKTGYNTLIQSVIAPAASSIIGFTISKPGGDIGVVKGGLNNWSLYPASIVNKTNQTVGLKVNSSNGSIRLAQLYLTVRSGGTTSFCSNSSVNTGAVNISCELNLTNATLGDYVRATGYIVFMLSDGSGFNQSINWNWSILAYYDHTRRGLPPTSLGGILDRLAGAVSGGFSLVFSALVATALTLVVSRFMPLGWFGAGFTMVGVLALFSVSDPPMFPGGLTVLIGIVVVAVWFFQRRGG